ncbi:MAG: hypothetical protein PHU81_02490 [Acidobacteriota bacterium]|nr:hypothetical protein [Acidobacteriota bacterium]
MELRKWSSGGLSLSFAPHFWLNSQNQKVPLSFIPITIITCHICPTSGL